MTKATVTPQIDAAIRKLREYGWGNDHIATVSILPGSRPLKALGSGIALPDLAYPKSLIPHLCAIEEQITTDELLKALYAGYEVQKTLEEELEEFSEQQIMAGDHDNDLILEGVKRTLALIAKHDERYRHLADWSARGFDSSLLYEAGEAQ